MSTIDPRLNTSLPSGLDALDRQAQLDRGLESPELSGLADEASFRGPTIDGGEATLMARAARESFDAGGLQARLAGSDRGSAVDQGVDEILAGLD